MLKKKENPTIRFSKKLWREYKERNGINEVLDAELRLKDSGFEEEDGTSSMSS